MRQLRLLLASLSVALALAGCSAEGAGTSNFELKSERVGWYAGEEATFTLTLSPSLLNSEPRFVLDRQFALEEVHFTERGVRFGGDFDTKNPDDLALRLVQNGTESQEVILDPAHPSVELRMTMPSSLRDSEYVLELKLFQVGWVKSEPFRVDVRG